MGEKKVQKIVQKAGWGVCAESGDLELCVVAKGAVTWLDALGYQLDSVLRDNGQGTRQTGPSGQQC